MGKLAYGKRDCIIAHIEIERLRSAGLLFNAHIMTGISGAENAALYQDVSADSFVLADETENLIAARRLSEPLETDSLIYEGFHDQVPLRVLGILPQYPQTMLLSNAIETYSHREPACSALVPREG